MMITHEQISQRAREIWEREGRPEGRDKEHWLQAESELRNEAMRSQTGRSAGSVDPALAKGPENSGREGDLRRRSSRRGR